MWLHDPSGRNVWIACKISTYRSIFSSSTSAFNSVRISKFYIISRRRNFKFIASQALNMSWCCLRSENRGRRSRSRRVGPITDKEEFLKWFGEASKKLHKDGKNSKRNLGFQVCFFSMSNIGEFLFKIGNPCGVGIVPGFEQQLLTVAPKFLTELVKQQHSGRYLQNGSNDTYNY